MKRSKLFTRGIGFPNLLFSDNSELKWIPTDDPYYPDVLVIINSNYNAFIELLKIEKLGPEIYRISHSHLYQTGISIILSHMLSNENRCSSKKLLKQRVKNALLGFSKLISKFNENETEKGNEDIIREEE